LCRGLTDTCCCLVHVRGACQGGQWRALCYGCAVGSVAAAAIVTKALVPHARLVLAGAWVWGVGECGCLAMCV
jgi:hypothetical protein